MKTTIDLPVDLINEAMSLTKAQTTNHIVVLVLKKLIKKHKLQKLKFYKGRFKLDIDLDELRGRKNSHGFN